MKKIQAFFLIIVIVFSSWSIAPKAHAYAGVLDTSLDFITGSATWTMVAKEVQKYATELKQYAIDNAVKVYVTASKMAALLAVQKITQAIIGKGDGAIITDYNSYFFVSPQQRALKQMDSFFNTVSRERLSKPYEGFGKNYDAYLVAQARQGIIGQPLTTNLQDYSSNPTQMLDGGNMRGFMAYFERGNNPASYSLIMQSQYANEIAKATKIAEMEQSGGFLPIKKDGRIMQPASILANAFTQIDKLGTDVILNAEAKVQSELVGAQAQIMGGAAINIAARSLDYATADAARRAAIQNKNDQFPFSLSYSASGIGLTANGVTVTTGVGAWTGSLQIGNTCAVAGFEVDERGVEVAINGVKRQCPYPSANASATPPSIACNNNADCNPGLIPTGTFVCNASKSCAKPAPQAPAGNVR